MEKIEQGTGKDASSILPSSEAPHGSVSKEVLDKVNASKQAKIKIYPCHVNRASNIGHPCERFLVYCRTAWNQKPVYDVALQYIFDEGRRQEKAVEEDLRSAGFELVEQQRPFEYKELKITGHIEGKILFPGRMIQYEVKSMAPHIWMSINTIEDMDNSRYVWVRGYPAQLQIYLLLDDSEYGIFILKNKSTGRLKTIDCYLDYVYAESLLRKVERVNAHVDAGTKPERVEDLFVCERCDFRHICLPDMGGVEFLDGRVINLLDERRDLMEIVEKSPVPGHMKRLNEIKGYLRKIFEGRDAVISGSYFISGKWKNSGKGKYWNLTIINSKQEDKNG